MGSAKEDIDRELAGLKSKFENYKIVKNREFGDLQAMLEMKSSEL